jgi:hypothetical protein
MTDDFGTPITPLSQPKKSNTVWIIVVVILLVLIICCCLALALAWQFGDQLVIWLQSMMGY